MSKTFKHLATKLLLNCDLHLFKNFAKFYLIRRHKAEFL
jgi:hypothetical protein